jgi:phosphatidylethanolamine/phosphatidyl-N-methylethanolamine N-methyltransferase
MVKTRIEKERDFWNKFAGQYDRFINYTFNETYKALYKALRSDVSGTDYVLEIATGTGLIAFEICDLVQQVEAIDIAPEMISIAQIKQSERNILNINFDIGDSSNLHFRDNTFDVVIASNVLHLLFDPEEALSEIYRVLKPGGKAMLATFCHGENIRSRLLSKFMEISGFKAINRWSTQSYAAFIKASGFEILTMEILPGKIPLAYIIVGVSGNNGISSLSF